jgi:hypothetical protein
MIVKYLEFIKKEGFGKNTPSLKPKKPLLSKRFLYPEPELKPLDSTIPNTSQKPYKNKPKPQQIQYLRTISQMDFIVILKMEY